MSGSTLDAFDELVAGDTTVELSVLVRAAERALRESGSETPRLDADLLACESLGLTRVQLYTESQRPLTRDERAAFAALVERRRRHEPVQYILGRAPFRMLELAVDARVLIPRPETELLVEWVLEAVAARHAVTGSAVPLVDVATGSGAIAIAVADEAPPGSVTVTATDLSADALEVARANVERCDVEVELHEGDLLTPVAGRAFGVVVSNPPYVPLSEREGLLPTVRDYEPELALFVDDDDGTVLVKRLADQALGVLEPGGLLAIEVGAGQAPAVAAVLEAAGFVDVERRRDLQGHERAVGGRAPG